MSLTLPTLLDGESQDDPLEVGPSKLPVQPLRCGIIRQSRSGLATVRAKLMLDAALSRFVRSNLCDPAVAPTF